MTPMIDTKHRFDPDRLVNTLATLLILASLVLAGLQIWTNRSLWVDEAALAQSVAERSLSRIVAKPLEHNQSAPVLYILSVKIITMIFGLSERSLRAFSVISFTASLYLVFRVARDGFKTRFPLIAPALMGTAQVILYYAFEFKQYMSDAMFALLAVHLYIQNQKKQIKFPLLITLYAILTWYSYPAIFWIGGILFYEFIRQIILRNRRQIQGIFIGGSLIVLNFAAQFMLWLRTTQESDYMNAFWQTYRFPIIPTSLADLIRGARLVYGFAMSVTDYPVSQITISLYPILFLLLAAAGLIISLFRRSPAVLVISFGILLLLVASFLGFYPFHPRLILSLYPMAFLMIHVAIETLGSVKIWRHKQSLSVLLIFILVILGQKSAFDLLKLENRYVQHEESKPAIHYVEENILSDEYFYSYGADMNLRFLNGYYNHHIGNQVDSAIDNIRFESVDDVKNPDFNYPQFLASDAYLLISHTNNDDIVKMIEPLQKQGYFELISDVADTPLFFHASSVETVKSSVEMTLLSLIESGDGLSGQLSIKNTGPSILNSPYLTPLELASRAMTDFKVAITEKNILPEQTWVVNFVIPADQLKKAEGPVDLQLRIGDDYWFDELGIPAIIISNK